MNYQIIYDGNCNLCVTLVQLLENLDQGKLFSYIPMQEEATISQWGITPDDCLHGMIFLDADSPQTYFQGSDAAEEIGKLLPLGDVFVSAYRTLPGMKSLGDNLYEFVKDNRYNIFGKRSTTYTSACRDGNCKI
jgi:predicted DCC family thiol-disulfide oxidoreductase YuxK